MAICALCGRKAKLCNSHPIPKFVVDWMKESSYAGYIRDPNEPNKPLQDIPHPPKLCSDCEGSLGKSEQCFAERIFKPFVFQEASEFDYEEWLLRFAVSISWRRVAGAQFLAGEVTEKTRLRFLEAERIWRDYLLGKRTDAGPYTQHLLLWQEPDDDATQSWRNPMRRMLGDVHLEVVRSDGYEFVFSHMARTTVVACIRPQDPRGFRGTRLRTRGRLRAAEQTYPEVIWELMVYASNRRKNQMSQLSDRQRHKISEAAAKKKRRR